jgi:hypothetical protein
MQDYKILNIKAPTSALGSTPHKPNKSRKQPHQTHDTSETPKNRSKQSHEHSQPRNGPSVKESEDAVGPNHPVQDGFGFDHATLHDRNLKTCQWVTMFTPMNTPTTKPAIPVVAFNADIPEIELDGLIYQQPEAVDNAKHIKALGFPYSYPSLGLCYEHIGSTDQGEPCDSDAELLAEIEGLAWASSGGHSFSGALVDLSVAQEL